MKVGNTQTTIMQVKRSAVFFEYGANFENSNEMFKLFLNFKLFH